MRQRKLVATVVTAKRLALALTSSTLISASADANALESPCAFGWFSVQAQIVRIEPAGRFARRISSQGKESDAGVDAVLCAGDTLVAPADVVGVEYYEGGRTVQLGPGQSHKLSSTAESASLKAYEYLRLAMSAVGALSTPAARPAPTSSRGPADSSASAPIKAILPLRDLPRQRMTTDLTLIVGWRDGIPPYRCEALDDAAKSIWGGSETKSGWCLYPVEAQRSPAARVVVRDAGRRTVGWNVAPAAWADVPRPEWIDTTATLRLRSADLTAWGVWLWNSSSVEWRLQSLAMLHTASTEQWLAAYVVENVLAETPPYLRK